LCPGAGRVGRASGQSPVFLSTWRLEPPAKKSVQKSKKAKHKNIKTRTKKQNNKITKSKNQKNRTTKIKKQRTRKNKKHNN
jgi:hypothetical protein